MTPRQLRRLQQKLERKAQKKSQAELSPLPKPELSEARLAANRANAQLSTGPTSSIGKQIVSQNRTRHGLTGKFRVLANESQAEFDLLLETFLREEAPLGEAEIEFVHHMAEALWLARRVARLQNDCMEKLDSPDEHERRSARKDLALFMRYQVTHDRTVMRYATELRKRRNERRRVDRGFESQKAREAQNARRDAAENRKQELHQFKQKLQQLKVLREEARLADNTHAARNYQATENAADCTFEGTQALTAAAS